MATAVYSHLFFSQVIVAGQGATFLVPAGTVAILRDVDLVAIAATSGADLRELPSGVRFATFSATAALQSFAWRGRQVFDPGTSIEVATSGGNWYARASGYLLTE